MAGGREIEGLGGAGGSGSTEGGGSAEKGLGAGGPAPTVEERRHEERRLRAEAAARRQEANDKRAREVPPDIDSEAPPPARKKARNAITGIEQGIADLQIAEPVSANPDAIEPWAGLTWDEASVFLEGFFKGKRLVGGVDPSELFGEAFAVVMTQASPAWQNPRLTRQEAENGFKDQLLIYINRQIAQRASPSESKGVEVERTTVRPEPEARSYPVATDDSELLDMMQNAGLTQEEIFSAVEGLTGGDRYRSQRNTEKGRRTLFMLGLETIKRILKENIESWSCENPIARAEQAKSIILNKFHARLARGIAHNAHLFEGHEEEMVVVRPETAAAAQAGISEDLLEKAIEIAKRSGNPVQIVIDEADSLASDGAAGMQRGRPYDAEDDDLTAALEQIAALESLETMKASAAAGAASSGSSGAGGGGGGGGGGSHPRQGVSLAEATEADADIIAAVEQASLLDTLAHQGWEVLRMALANAPGFQTWAESQRMTALMAAEDQLNSLTGGRVLFRHMAQDAWDKACRAHPYEQSAFACVAGNVLYEEFLSCLSESLLNAGIQQHARAAHDPENPFTTAHAGGFQGGPHGGPAPSW